MHTRKRIQRRIFKGSHGSAGSVFIQLNDEHNWMAQQVRTPPIARDQRASETSPQSAENLQACAGKEGIEDMSYQANSSD